MRNSGKIYEFVDLSKTIMVFMLFTLIFFMISNLSSKKTIDFVETEMVIYENSKESFSEEKLKELVYSLNLKFPEIIIAQSYLETGNFESKIFFENNNLFDIKVVIQIPTTTIGLMNNHAYYNNWKESVYDYVLYQSIYLSSIKTEDDYDNHIPNYYWKLITYNNKIETYKISKDVDL